MPETAWWCLLKHLFCVTGIIHLVYRNFWTGFGILSVYSFLFIFFNQLFEILCNIKNSKTSLILMLFINAGNLVILWQHIKPTLSLQIYCWIIQCILSVVRQEVTREFLFSFLSIISITCVLMSWTVWTLAVSYRTCSPSITFLECLIYYYFSGGEYVSPEVSSYKGKNNSKILPVEMCGCKLHYWRFVLCYDSSLPFCLKINPYVMRLICDV